MTTTATALHVAVIGLEFGAEFVPIYKDHPGVRKVTIADLNAARAAGVADRFGIDSVRASLDQVLADPDVDAVHLVTGLHQHADQVVSALEAGKHVACTVPMALSFEDIERVLAAREAAGRSYMMMETAVYTREYLFAEQLVRSGSMGRIAYARGTHFQDMTAWPDYWTGLPPMFYATHAISPILRLLDARASRVRGIGGGRLPDAETQHYGNPFPVESALVQLEGRDVVVELTRSLSQLARAYTESFSIYGDRQGFEWAQLETLHEHPVLFTMGERANDRGRPIDIRRVDVPDRPELLPPAIARYTTQFAYGADGESSHRSFLQGGGHGGSHPHLVHEFVASIIEERAPAIDHTRAANWTATGIAAHLSALRGGEEVVIPSW